MRIVGLINRFIQRLGFDKVYQAHMGLVPPQSMRFLQFLALLAALFSLSLSELGAINDLLDVHSCFVQISLANPPELDP